MLSPSQPITSTASDLAGDLMLQMDIRWPFEDERIPACMS